MVEKRTWQNTLFTVVNGLMVLMFTLLFLYPLWHVLMASFSDPSDLLVHTGPLLVPAGFSMEGYEMVLKRTDIWIGYTNTLFYVVAGTVVNVVLTSMGAYALSRRNLKIRKFLNVMVVMTMYLSGGLIPNFLVVRYLGLYDSRWALILPGAIATWNLIVLRTGFQQVPRELEESAMIDGANDFVILFQVVIPIARATLVVIALFYAVSHWNAWFNASIYLMDRNKWPLALYLREILLQNTTVATDVEASSIGGVYHLDELIKYCSIIVSTLPILCIYPFAQKYFVKGVMMGSLKG